MRDAINSDLQRIVFMGHQETAVLEHSHFTTQMCDFFLWRLLNLFDDVGCGQNVETDPLRHDNVIYAPNKAAKDRATIRTLAAYEKN